MQLTRFQSVVMAATAGALLAGCSSGGGTTAGVGDGFGGNFQVVRSSPTDRAQIFLNDPVLLDFSSFVELRSADLNTVQFQVFDLNGNPLQEQVQGTFELGTASGDTEMGRRLVFRPAFASNDDYDNGGFRGSRQYIVSLSAGDEQNGTVLTDTRPRGLDFAFSASFRTPESTELNELFRDQAVGGPRVVRVDVTPRDNSDEVALNGPGDVPVEVRVQFDQPLDPASTNIPTALSADPLVRADQDRGRIFLQYDDPEFGADQWVPATVDLESNVNDGALIVLRPIGILPNNAEIEVVVTADLRDLSGQSNRTNLAFNPIAASFRTRALLAPQFDAIVETFSDLDQVDFDAVFAEPRADVSPGSVTASFDFDGVETTLDYRPTDREVIIDTGFDTISPVGSPPINVFGGVFRFRDVTIPQGTTVLGVGPNPMVWQVTGDFTIAGELSVNGGPGQLVSSLLSSNIPSGGGVGVCGAGNGGLGSPQTTQRSLAGQTGFGPFQRPGVGGRGGQNGCNRGNGRNPCGSGGGGGAFSTQGDPFYPPPNNGSLGTQWEENRLGIGGTDSSIQGCTANGTPDGGDAGDLPWVDGRPENNFWGSGIDNFRSVRVQGELLRPIGGSGGGGGGDQGPSCSPDPASFLNVDRQGGGGGAGGGILMINALGRITIESTGRVTSNGGDGGGGEQAGTNSNGGGGGGGSGGMIVLASATGIDIHRSATYAERDFDFAISADGGISIQGDFQEDPILGKYRPVIGTPAWGNRNVGGFGGLGLIQLMVPPGNNLDDQTNTSLDDNINFFEFDPLRGDIRIIGARKEELLGWRGYRTDEGTARLPDGTPPTFDLGNGVDDAGVPINLQRSEGAMRPSPVLLPTTFGPLSRVRSKWLDLGFAARRRVDPGTGGSEPRAVEAPAGEAPRPDFTFEGTINDPARPDAAGYVATSADGSPVPARVLASGSIESFDADAVFEGALAYEVRLAPGTITGVADDELSSYRLRLLDSSDRAITDFRILAHRGDVVFLAPDAFPPEGAVSAEVVAKFFGIKTDGQPGLGLTFALDNRFEPQANVRFGFRFAVDPTDPTAPRWPDSQSAEDFEFDLDLTRNAGLRDFLDANSPTFFQYDILFNRTFDPTAANALRLGISVTSSLPFPEVEFLTIPIRH